MSFRFIQEIDMTMSRRWITPFVPIAFALLCQPRAYAGEFNVSPRTEELLKRGSCWGCHGVDEVRIGPPFRNIAQRYQNSGSEQMEVLTAKIRFGGAGNWGVVPMFPHPELSTSETTELLKWILALPPR
jgi:cytochrome c551/c552